MGAYNQNWDEISRNIQSLVDEAIQSKDYEKLSQSIRITVNKAVNLGNDASKKCTPAAGSAQQRGNTGTAGAAKVGTVESRNLPALYGSTNKQTIYGILKILGGGFLTLGTVFRVLWVALRTIFLGESFLTFSSISTILFFCGGAYLIAGGVRTLGMVNRFSVYRRTIGQKTYCTLENLARSVRKNTAFVRDELTRMIEKGFFIEGHLDNEGNNLIISNETYRRFEQSRLALEQQKKTAVAAAPTPTPQQPTQDDAKVQDVLTRGNAFIRQIRKCNDDIPGEEISNKIDRIETLVRQIFQRAQANPEIVPDLQKMMDYYLPMTVKLLNAYAEMDAQPVQGTTIQASKQEIEETIDTLILAFEKLLDSVFQDTALDVSSDISVLNTLLAQDGLVEDDLTKLKKQKQSDEKGESVCSQK